MRYYLKSFQKSNFCELFLLNKISTLHSIIKKIKFLGILINKIIRIILHLQKLM